MQQQDIARQLGVTGATISRDVKRIREEWRKEYAGDYHFILGEDLAILSDDERRWRTEMLKTLQGGYINTHIRLDDGTEEERRVWVPPDQMSALGIYDRILSIMKQRAKLTGVEAPQKIAPTSPDGEKEFSGLSESDYAKRLLAMVNVSKQ
jgi:hypothetical protein